MFLVEAVVEVVQEVVRTATLGLYLQMVRYRSAEHLPSFCDPQAAVVALGQVLDLVVWRRIHSFDAGLAIVVSLV